MSKMKRIEVYEIKIKKACLYIKPENLNLSETEVKKFIKEQTPDASFRKVTISEHTYNRAKEK